MAVPINLQYPQMNPPGDANRYPPDVFSLSIIREYAQERCMIECVSRVCGVHERIDLHPSWVLEHGERALEDLVQFIRQRVGGALASISINAHDPMQMARDAMPNLMHEVHAHMGRLERSRWGATAPAGSPNTRLGDYPVQFLYGRGSVDPRSLFGTFAPMEPEHSPATRGKARTLLLQNLDANQRSQFERESQFTVKAKDGKCYIISSARSFNVLGPDGAKYCGQTPETPVEDQMLAQKLLLEHDPDQFFKNSNKTGGRGTNSAVGSSQWIGQQLANRIERWRL